MSYQKIFDIINSNTDSFENTQEEEIASENNLSQNSKSSKYIFFVSKDEKYLIKKKRGRPSLKVNKNSEINHNKYKIDNIRIKIKTHYHSFIIEFFNDLIKLKFKIQRYKFRKISYSITKDVI
jgi:hypothetical protein